MISLRQMHKSDLPRVNLILSKSFTQGRIEDGYKKTHVPLCRIEFLEMYLASCPRGCFVMEIDGDIVAYSFSHLWGEIGWIGPLGVIPTHQGKGLGREVVTRCIEFLKASGAKTIGLETMPRSYKNLTFYTKIGFVPQQLIMELTKTVYPKLYEDEPREYQIWWYNRLPAESRKRFLSEVQDLSQNIEPGLDYSSEIKAIHDFKYGDALLMEVAGRPLAMALGHTEPYSSEENREVLRVIALMLAPDTPLQVINHVLCEMENLARAEYLTTLCIRVPTRYWRGYKFLVEQDFKIVHSDIRMTLIDYPQRDNPDNINFSKWE